MNTIIQKYQGILNETKDTLTQEIETLQATDRNDEANCVKVELNIVDIFEKMFGISVKKAGADNLQVLSETYLAFFEKIPVAWKENLRRATAHDDTETIHVETLKLDRAEQLKQAFMEQCHE